MKQDAIGTQIIGITHQAVRVKACSKNTNLNNVINFDTILFVENQNLLLTIPETNISSQIKSAKPE